MNEHEYCAKMRQKAYLVVKGLIDSSVWHSQTTNKVYDTAKQPHTIN